jgi:hypothetical protein
MTATIGRIVHYTLTAEDAEHIGRRRTTIGAIATRLEADRWPRGAQAHIGTEPQWGAVVPMIVVAVHGVPRGARVNGQCFLDGTDVLWVRDVEEGTLAGQWHWPPRVS